MQVPSLELVMQLKLVFPYVAPQGPCICFVFTTSWSGSEGGGISAEITPSIASGVPGKSLICDGSVNDFCK